MDATGAVARKWALTVEMGHGNQVPQAGCSSDSRTALSMTCNERHRRPGSAALWPKLPWLLATLR
jgi:hypothetical protein